MNKGKNFLILLAVTVILASTIVISGSIREAQIFKNNAAVKGGIGQIYINPLTTAQNVGSLFPVTLSINTGGALISSTSLRITYPYSSATPELDIVDQTGQEVNQISPDTSLISSGDWAFPINSVTRTNNLVTLDFVAINVSTTGFTSTSNTPLATIYFKVNSIRSPRNITLTFDPTKTTMMTKSNPTDILNIPTNAVYRLKK